MKSGPSPALTVAVTVAFALTSWIFAQDGADAIQAKILAVENAWNVAETHQGTEALDRLMSYSLIYIAEDGTLMDKAQFLSSVKKHPTDQKIVTESMAARVYGTTAIVTGIYRVSGVSQGKPFSRRGRFLDTWVQGDGNWLCVAAQATVIGRGN